VLTTDRAGQTLDLERRRKRPADDDHGPGVGPAVEAAQGAEVPDLDIRRYTGRPEQLDGALLDNEADGSRPVLHRDCLHEPGQVANGLRARVGLLGNPELGRRDRCPDELDDAGARRVGDVERVVPQDIRVVKKRT
jgi:hypothetical protein